jgi:broad specificity phosphatase PhoE
VSEVSAEAAPARAAGVVTGTRRLIAARHGQTAWNAAGRYQGHADVELDAEGRAQAEALAVAVVAALAPQRPLLIVASDLRRAVATAAPLAAGLGLSVVVDARLREVDVGAWEGLTPEEAADRFPAEYQAWRTGDDVARGGGETRADAGRRAATALLEHASAVAPGQAALAVAHGMVLRSAVRQLRAWDRVNLDGDPPHLANAAWMDLILTV